MVKLLTDDELREEMEKVALDRGRDYDWRKIVDKKVKIYDEVITDFKERNKKG